MCIRHILLPSCLPTHETGFPLPIYTFSFEFQGMILKIWNELLQLLTNKLKLKELKKFKLCFYHCCLKVPLSPCVAWMHYHKNMKFFVWEGCGVFVWEQSILFTVICFLGSKDPYILAQSVIDCHNTVFKEPLSEIGNLCNKVTKGIPSICIYLVFDHHCLQYGKVLFGLFMSLCLMFKVIVTCML